MCMCLYAYMCVCMHIKTYYLKLNNINNTLTKYSLINQSLTDTVRVYLLFAIPYSRKIW